MCVGYCGALPGGRHVLSPEEVGTAQLPPDCREPTRRPGRAPVRHRHARAHRRTRSPRGPRHPAGLRRALLRAGHAPLGLGRSRAIHPPLVPAHRWTASVWALVGQAWGRGRAPGAAGAARLRVRPRAGRVRRHPAPPLRLGLGPRLRVVDAGLCRPGTESLSLHHFYRAMAWLGEELPEERQDHATPFSPRTVKDEIEEALFARHRDLFTDLSVVFMDTTSLAFEGEGGETLGAYGYSKDHRPDLKQMILAVVVDAEGRPICTEMMPGNTADVSVLVPVIDRLRHRFGMTRVCVVADRGMISEATIAALDERGFEYVLGVRERTDTRVRTVLDDARPFTPLLIERARGETQLFVKEVQVEGIRYIAARNEAEAEKDAADRAAIVAALDQQLKRGDKALIGNSAYRRYLRTTAKKALEIDIGKVAEEARYDGLFVLRTNAWITPLQTVLRYRELLTVEALFRATKASFDTRPIFHSSDAAIRGHVFCSFLALLLQKELFESCADAGTAEWANLLRDLDRLQEAT